MINKTQALELLKKDLKNMSSEERNKLKQALQIVAQLQKPVL